MGIKCNNVPRPVLDWPDLTEKEQQEFDYLETYDAKCYASFARYRGVVYDLHEFTRITAPIAPQCQRPGWENFHGYASDSFYSGVLVKFVDDLFYGERVVMATYYC